MYIIKKISILTLIVSIVFLSGCQNKSHANDSETYGDESHKQIYFGKLSLDMDSYHIVSYSKEGGIDSYQCQLDNGEKGVLKDLNIQIQEGQMPSFQNLDEQVKFLKGKLPTYSVISIFNNLEEASGIQSFYSISGKDKSQYWASYGDKVYQVKTNCPFLDRFILNYFLEPSYSLYKNTIECGKSQTADISKVIEEDHKINYEVSQNLISTKFKGTVTYNEEDELYTFELKDETDKVLMSFENSASEIDLIVDFIDVNRDGYLDIKALDEEGTLNNSYILFTWNPNHQVFDKVKCSEMLSEIEVYDQYIKNWAKNTGDTGVVQKLEWKGNALVKVSEEPYDEK